MGTIILALWVVLAGLAPPTWGQRSDEQTLFSVATQAYQDGLYDLARDQLQTYLTTYPRGAHLAEVSYLLGDYFYRRRDFERSSHYLRQALQHHLPEALQPDARYLLGRSYIETAHFTEAVEAFRPLVDAAKSGRWQEAALYWLSEALLSSGNVAPASQFLERLSAGFPHSPYLEQGLYALGYAQQQSQAHEQGLQTFQELLSRFPQSQLRRPAEYGVARALTALQRFAEAAPYWEQLSHSASSPAEVEETVFWWAESWRRAEHCDRAGPAFQEYLRRFPQGGHRQEALSAIATCAHNAGDLRAEIVALESLSVDAVEPLRGSVLLRLADAHEQLGELQAAYRLYSQWLLAFPDHPQRSAVLSRRGLISRQQGDDARVIEDFTEVLQRTDDTHQRHLAHSALAESYIRLNDCEAARPHLSEVIAHGGQEARQRARVQRGVCAYHAKAFAEAAAEFAELADDATYHGDRQSLLLPLGHSLVALQRYAEAVVRFRQLLALNPAPDATEQALSGLGASLLAVGRIEEALPVYEQLLSLNPNLPGKERLHLRLGLLYRQRQELEAAKSHFAAAVDGGDAAIGAEALYQWSDLLLEEGATTEARRRLQQMTRQFASQDRWVSIASYRLALLHEAAEQWPEAWQAYLITATTAIDPKLLAAARERAKYLEETVDVHARPDPDMPTREHNL